MSKMRQTQKTEKKDNRKSILLIALLLMLVAIIGFGGYTLSKYITSKKSEGSAQVAKWGFTVDADNSKLFGSEYKWNQNVTASTTDGTGTLTVKADTANTRNLVAPGTTGSMTFSVKGKAEVLAQVEMKVADGYTDIALKLAKDGENYTYNPVKWTLTKKNADGTNALVTAGTLEEVVAALNGQYKTEEGKDTATIAIGTEINDEYTLSWAWAFEGTAVPAGVEGLTSDQLDTLLGQGTETEANGYELTYVSTVKFELNISVTQRKN